MVPIHQNMTLICHGNLFGKVVIHCMTFQRSDVTIVFYYYISSDTHAPLSGVVVNRPSAEATWTRA